MKENIKDLSSSLSHLKQLQSVSYNLKEEKIEEVIPEKFLKEGVDIELLKAEINKTPKTNEHLLSRNFYGFLAQDVQKIFPDLVYADDAGMLSIDYIGMIPLLVDGLQEQQQLIEKLQQQKEIEILQNIVLSQEKDVTKLKELQLTVQGLQEIILLCCEKTNNLEILVLPEENEQTNSEKAILYQNTPNPFSSNTKIVCYLPETANRATLYIYNLQGVELKSYPISQMGVNTITVTGSELPAGMYLYTLVVDNVIVDTKRMILTK